LKGKDKNLLKYLTVIWRNLKAKGQEFTEIFNCDLEKLESKRTRIY
jgi:hypothetical protein